AVDASRLVRMSSARRALRDSVPPPLGGGPISRGGARGPGRASEEVIEALVVFGSRSGAIRFRIGSGSDRPDLRAAAPERVDEPSRGQIVELGEDVGLPADEATRDLAAARRSLAGALDASQLVQDRVAIRFG